MNELLANQAVQTALILVIVTGLNAVVTWLKQKFPTQTALVESNWCYLHPVIDAAINAAQSELGKSSLTTTAVSSIVSKALVDFADSYRKFEGKEASPKEINAAQIEIAKAVGKLTE